MAALKFYPWQLPAWQALTSANRQGRLPPALLLLGPQGMGKLEFAHCFAQHVLCRSVDAIGLPCQQCRDCRLFSGKNHPDFLLLTPQEKSKQIKLDQVRELIATLSQTSQQAGYQVALIYPAESLNLAASNALLKTLEEPAGAVLWMLVATQTKRLPATIVSRCQRLIFAAQDSETVKAWLTEQLESGANIPLLLKAAEYAPLQALTLHQKNYLALRDEVLHHLGQVRQGVVNPLAPITAYLKKDLLLLLQAMLTFVLDMLRLQNKVEARWITNEDRIFELNQLKQYCSATFLQQQADQLHQARVLLESHLNPNVQLLLENLLLMWSNSSQSS